MKASKKLIKFYKGCVLAPIVEKCKVDGNEVTTQQMDTYLKSLVDLDKSCIEMSMDELGEVIRQGFLFGDDIGLNLDFRKDDLDEIVKLFE
jgi:hypothetical protein